MTALLEHEHAGGISQVWSRTLDCEMGRLALLLEMSAEYRIRTPVTGPSVLTGAQKPVL